MSFKQPDVFLTETVLFMPHEGADAVPAVVCKIGSRTLDLYAMGNNGPVFKPGVHHQGDPDLENFPEWRRSGIWVKAPADRKYAILAEKVALLESKVEALSEKKDRKGNS